MQIKYFLSFFLLGDVPEEKIHFCERFLELLIDLEAQLPTRRFFNILVDDSHIVVRSRLSPLAQRKEGHLFKQLLDMLQFYAGFEISDQLGEALSDREMTIQHYEQISSLQVLSLIFAVISSEFCSLCKWPSVTVSSNLLSL